MTMSAQCPSKVGGAKPTNRLGERSRHCYGIISLRTPRWALSSVSVFEINLPFAAKYEGVHLGCTRPQQELGMTSTKKTRIAGVLYLVNGVTGFFSIINVPSRLFGSGDTTATAHNILASERLFRLGIASEVICAVEYLSALGAVPIAQRGEQNARFADGDLRCGLRSHYVASDSRSRAPAFGSCSVT